MTKRGWDGKTYDRIGTPQLEWGKVVLDRLELRGDETIVDAGCGSGRVTELLLERLPHGHVIALDGSASMIEAARERLGGQANIEFTVMDLLEGDEDTVVQVTWRTRDGKVRESQTPRELVPPETVFSEMVGNILLVRISGFSSTTDSHLLLVLRDAFGGGRPVDGIIVDLRGNRGGLVRQAVSAADILLPPGIVAITAGRAPEANHVWRSYADELGEDIPVVVVVDGRTASAAEILAAALADRGRAVVVGSSTLGKGLVQTIAQMPDGGELFVTWSRILAPLGWPIHGLGLLPQVCTSRGMDVVRRQLEALAAGRNNMGPDISAHRKARAPLTAARIQTIRNACPPAEGREVDLDAARALIANPVAYETALLPMRPDLR